GNIAMDQRILLRHAVERQRTGTKLKTCLPTQWIIGLGSPGQDAGVDVLAIKSPIAVRDVNRHTIEL
ncbi:hypothetical protein, partial [Sodalis-like endosymbiont of Proechinophthirus fluctus]|uniref:hypothetical protein n=1 Tax=Sodalis-like endosymbiont of Proechinophthirus fluctus TaxID=1462730 RepID=UPI0019581917